MANYDKDQIGSLEFYTRTTKAFKARVETDNGYPEYQLSLRLGKNNQYNSNILDLF